MQFQLWTKTASVFWYDPFQNSKCKLLSTLHVTHVQTTTKYNFNH